jgi:hypothetical protein
MTPSAIIEEAIELATRASDGVEVSLFWERGTGRTWVDVTVPSTGEHFTVEAMPARALDVFHHPYAYAEPLLAA